LAPLLCAAVAAKAMRYSFVAFRHKVKPVVVVRSLLVDIA
jgi:hypothetical protein